MPSQQRLIRLQIERLKNLTDVTIEFEEDKRLTAILGPNGFGKSTVLHALAASFRPAKIRRGNTISPEGEDHRYIDFFPNTPHGTWANTNFKVIHFVREGATTRRDTLSVSKGTRQWLPLAPRRPERPTYFIGVASSTPAIENTWPRSKLTYTTQDLTDADSLEIKQKAGHILQRDYTRYHSNSLSNRRRLIGVEYQGVNYSALSMGAGEQRLFRILRQVKSASDYSLILIDEVDLLLHTEALHRLLGVLNDYATAKKLQIIFTTHRESVVNFDSFVAIRHLYRSPVAPHKTFCFKDTKPDAIYRLTGEIHRPLQVSCEDDISTAIIEKVAQQAGVGGFVEISKFGAVDNCFTLAAALMLTRQNLRRSLFVLDGDRYTTDQERQTCIQRALTGTELDAPERRRQALDRIVQFSPNGMHCPEHALHMMVASVGPSDDRAENEVINAAAEFGAEQDPKERIIKLIERLGGSTDRALVRIIDVASKSAYWPTYTAQVRAWFDQQKPDVVETHA